MSKTNTAKGVCSARFGSVIDFSKPVDSSVIRDRVALVTGGASGLAGGLVVALAEAGAHVAIADQNVESATRIAGELTSKGLSAKAFKVDTTSWESQVALFKSVLRWQDNHLDIVVTAAEEPPEPSIHTIQVNLIGVFYSSFLALFYFRKLAKSRRAGFDPQLLVVSSLAGYVARDVGSDYAASKWGSRGFWKTIRYIASGHGHTQTNLVAPTYIDTPMISAFVPTLKDAGITVGAVDDFVQGSMRVLCDSAVDGRAICIAAGGNEPGSKNFDLEDDMEDGDGNLQIRKEAEARVFGTMFD